jgi:hypothetical protein
VLTIAFMYFTIFVIMLLRMGLIFLYYCYVPQCLQPLRIYTHSPMTWDERYEPFIRRVRFLPLARLITGGLPMMNSTVLTALVDRWRPETHMFHLSCEETTVSLQDVAMILGLPIDGMPVCGTVSPRGTPSGLLLACDPRRSHRPEGQEDDGCSLWVAQSSLRHLPGGC